MNRKERRNTEKHLGLFKHYKTLSREEKWEKMRDNQENGKRIMEETRRKVEQGFQESEDKIVNAKITDKAEKIAREKKIPMIDAIVEAQEETFKTSK